MNGMNTDKSIRDEDGFFMISEFDNGFEVFR